MSRILSFSLISTLLISSNLFNLNSVKADNQHSQHQHHKSSQQHGKIEIPSDQPVPKVDLIVHPDAMQGWNLELKLTNFNFTPEKLNQNSNFIEGHAHLYINGKKVGRIYSTWYYLQKLPVGKNKITVTLNSNQHADLFYNGKPIGASATIIVKGKK